MSDRENLLNNLKIDRSAAPSEEKLPSNRLYLLGAAVLLVSFFWWLFLSDDELKEVTTFKGKIITRSLNAEKKTQNQSFCAFCS